jgi:hypothetical protein
MVQGKNVAGGGHNHHDTIPGDIERDRRDFAAFNHIFPV